MCWYPRFLRGAGAWRVWGRGDVVERGLVALRRVEDVFFVVVLGDGWDLDIDG